MIQKLKNLYARWKLDELTGFVYPISKKPERFMQQFLADPKATAKFIDEYKIRFTYEYYGKMFELYVWNDNKYYGWLHIGSVNFWFHEKPNLWENEIPEPYTMLKVKQKLEKLL